jgi:hypothetical protein
MSIEDELRELLAPNTAIPVYSRQLPPDLPPCLCIQEIGGRTNNSNIRRAVHFISILAVAPRIEDARAHMAQARDFLTTHLPADIGGVHYYTAVPLAEGTIKQKAPRGPAYIMHTTLEVTRQL